MSRTNKGITLIALVITLIVLIILAGISIAVLTGEDGLITKAKQGAQNYQNAAIEEQQALNTIYAQAGTQLAVGSTNNGGTTENQGTAPATTGGGSFASEDHEMLEALYNKMYKVPNLNNINPDKIQDSRYYAAGSTAQANAASAQTAWGSAIPVAGYSKIYFMGTNSYLGGNGYWHRFILKDGTVTGASSLPGINNWYGFDIPEDAEVCILSTLYSNTSGNYAGQFYALEV